LIDAKYRKKLIEVSLPLEAINREASHEKSVPRRGHPATMHLYWARRPITAARAILFAQLVDDPSSHPDKFPTEELQGIERARLHSLIERLSAWENTQDFGLMEEAKEEILASNDGIAPSVLDPFAGGGSIPLEAQRLGLKAYASDLNPVAVLLNKSLIEFSPRFANRAPIFPGAEGERSSWQGNQGLAEDVRLYGELLRNKAEELLKPLYPSVEAGGGTRHTVVGWLWSRTVKSPNPANPIDTPLVRTWWLSKKKKRETWIEASVLNGEVKYTIQHNAKGPDQDGTVGRTGAVSVSDGTPISLNYIRNEGRNGNLGRHLIAIIAEGDKGRIYIDPQQSHIDAANVSRPSDVPDAELPKNPRDFKTPNYGMTRWSDLFTNRQLTTLTTISDLLPEIHDQVVRDAIQVGLENGDPLQSGGSGARAYADAIATYLAFAVSKLADWSSSQCGWIPAIEGVRDTFARQAIPMVWDYIEINPFSSSVGNLSAHIRWVADGVDSLPTQSTGFAEQADAATRMYDQHVISTDPPYYDNINYSELSDFFYLWLRRSLQSIHSDLFSTLLTPKDDELVANSYRHGGKDKAEVFFVEGFNRVFSRIRETSSSKAPLTVYYAYKQQDADTEASSTSSTGWQTLLSGLIQSGWEITATWPIRSERGGRMISVGTNALASSIVLACRPREDKAEATTRRAFLSALKSELPQALRELMQGTIAPVDLAQAAIGPGIAVFSRYSRVREADGSDMSVREALLLINATLDEVLNEQESDFDPETRFAVKWYRQYGWTEGPSGMADQLARSSDTSIGALERGGFFHAKAGKAKLLSPALLDEQWNPEIDDKISIWECVIRLAGVMSRDGADSVARLLPSIEKRVGLDPVKELGFLLFHEAEKKSDAKDALLFNGLVGAWGDIREQARKLSGQPEPGYQLSFDFEEQGNS